MSEGDWDWWQAKLAGEPVQMNPSTPHAGFYRMSHKESYGARKTFKPVAYWAGLNGKLCCRIGDDDVTPERGEEIWERVGNHPVSEEAYRAVAEQGLPWPDEHELVPMGDNLPPPDDSLEGLRDAIEPLAEEAKKRIEGPPIETQDEANRLANLADRLAELWKKADDLRKAEKRPYDLEAERVQKRWLPILHLAETYKNIKYALLTPWLKREEARKRVEAEAAAAAGISEAASESARRPRAGTRGRAMALKSTKRAEITDYAACLQFFAENEDVKGTIQMLANRAVRAGITVPGTKVIEESQAV